MLYQIHTEDLDRASVEALLSEEFSEYSILSGDGSWNGKKEKTLVIEVVGERLSGKIRRVVDKIKAVSAQEIPNSSYLI